MRPALLLIGEGDALEGERCASRRRRDGRGGLQDLRLGCQQPLEALGGCKRRLEDVVVLGEVGDGTEETLHVLQERNENAERERPALRPDTPCHQKHRHPDRDQQLDARVEHRVVEDPADVHVAVRGIELAKPS